MVEILHKYKPIFWAVGSIFTKLDRFVDNMQHFSPWSQSIFFLKRNISFLNVTFTNWTCGFSFVFSGTFFFLEDTIFYSRATFLWNIHKSGGVSILIRNQQSLEIQQAIHKFGTFLEESPQRRRKATPSKSTGQEKKGYWCGVFIFFPFL